MDNTMEILPYTCYHLKLWILIFIITGLAETMMAKDHG
jgi:hypothetical protein